MFPNPRTLRKLRALKELVKGTGSGYRISILDKSTWEKGLPIRSKAISWDGWKGVCEQKLRVLRGLYGLPGHTFGMENVCHVSRHRDPCKLSLKGSVFSV